jgi:hypothetical protein
MFGFIALGFFASIAFGFATSKLAGKDGLIATIFGSLMDSRSDEEREKDSEKKEKELKALLKKKPEDLTEKDKRRISELSSDPDLNLDDILTDKEREALEKATGNTIEEIKNEQDTERKTIQNKYLALAQKKLDDIEDDNSEEAKQARQDYDALIKCCYNENGEPLSNDDINKNVNNLPEDIRKRIEKSAKSITNDPEAMKEFEESFSKISDGEAAAAVENAKASRLEITKREKIEALEKEKQSELAGATGEEKDKIEKKYKDQIEGVTKEYDAKIKSYRDKAAEYDKTEKLKQEYRIAKAEKAKLELEKEKLEKSRDEGGDVDVKKYLDFEFGDGLTPGDLTGDDPEKKKQAEEQLKKEGLDPELFVKISTEKSKNKDAKPEDISNNLKKQVNDNINKQIEEIDKKIEEQNKVISKYKEVKSGTSNTNNTNNEPSTQNKEGNTKKEEDSFETEDGTKYYIKDGKYYMETPDGDSSEVDKEDWEKEKENAVDDEKEGDERTDNDDDLEDDDEEKDEKTGEVTKSSTKDPKKVWKRRTYKRGNKTFKTKSYYNKKGNSISAKDFKEKVQNYEKNNSKPKNENSIIYFIKNKDIIVEQFKPTVGLIDYIHSKS